MCSHAIRNDPLTFGIECTKNLLNYQEIVVEHATDIERLKRDGALAARGESIGEAAPPAIMVITNATVLTMETGSPQGDLLRNALLVVRDGVIQLVTPMPAVVPQGSFVFNAMGGEKCPSRYMHARPMLLMADASQA